MPSINHTTTLLIIICSTFVHYGYNAILNAPINCSTLIIFNWFHMKLVESDCIQFELILQLIEQRVFLVGTTGMAIEAKFPYQNWICLGSSFA